MSASDPTRFAFVLCQPGAEPALKRELAQSEPDWAPAYQRPGLVTFRTGQPVTPELHLSSVFARAYGASLGTVAAGDLEAVAARTAALPVAHASGAELRAGPLCLHVIERAPARPDELAPSPRLVEFEAALRRRLDDAGSGTVGGMVSGTDRAEPGQLVLSVIVGDEPGWLLGLHRHNAAHCPYPGGRYPLALPDDAPSRAYLKIEEAIVAFELPFKAGDTALEIGAAPGGAAYALVRRGVHVVAVDPAEMDPAVLAFEGPRAARVTHLPCAVSELERAALPARVEWLLLDVHLAPQVALRSVRRLASIYKHTLLGAVLTLKLNDWQFARSVPSFLLQAREMGLVEPRAKQLVSHRQELAIVGLTARGQSRV